jgi:hypothetical protein
VSFELKRAVSDVETSARGARGYEVRSGSGSTEFVNWPPLALEIELADHKWQAVRVSDNIADGSVLQLLKLPDGTVKVLVEGGYRARITGFTDNQDFFQATAETIAPGAVVSFRIASFSSSLQFRRRSTRTSTPPSPRPLIRGSFDCSMSMLMPP